MTWNNIHSAASQGLRRAGTRGRAVTSGSCSNISELTLGWKQTDSESFTAFRNCLLLSRSDFLPRQTASLTPSVKRLLMLPMRNFPVHAGRHFESNYFEALRDLARQM